MTPLNNALLAIRSCGNKDPYAVARARAMLIVYHEQWGGKWADDYEILAVEKEFKFPLLNPDTESESKTFAEAGKMDVVVRRRSTCRVTIVEHKTTSDEVAPDSDYWDRVRMDTQCSKYFLAATVLGHEVESVCYDVVSKPGQRPLQIPERDAEGFKIVLDQAGQRVLTANGKKPRETGDAEKGYVLQTRAETPDEFESRLLTILRASPGDYFAQREVPRLNSDLLDYMNDAWQTSQEILYRRRTKCWPRNPDACKALGTCEFYNLCVGRASIDGVFYRKAASTHAELSAELQTGNRELLTTSRTKALHRCARLHQLRYEDCVELGGEVSEALSFGTLMHAGWEAYFKALKGNQ